MDSTFLSNFLKVAKRITHAERCMVVDTNLKVLDSINIDQAMIETSAFGEFAMECLREALDTGDAVITNNVITDPSDAPTTNTNFSNLRVVVALPIKDQGAVYLDQHIRNGIIPKQMIERIMRLISYIQENKLEDKDESELYDLYQKV